MAASQMSKETSQNTSGIPMDTVRLVVCHALYILKQGFGRLLSFKMLQTCDRLQLDTSMSQSLQWINLHGQKIRLDFTESLLTLQSLTASAVGFLPCVKGCRATGTQRRTPFNLGKNQLENWVVEGTSSEFLKLIDRVSKGLPEINPCDGSSFLAVASK